MTFLPIVERELRVASRRRGTYRTRFLAGLVGVVVASWITVASHVPEHELGANIFIIEAWLIFLYTGIAGTLATSDSLSEEKREGTLGLLFLTDLRGSDVVLGKLAATSIHAIYGMFAVIPILALPLLFGGVTRLEVLRAVLVALNLLFFFLSIGLAASAVCRRDNTAYGLSILVGLALLIFCPLASQIGRHPNPDPRAALLSSPGYACFLVSDLDYNRTAVTRADFWTNTLVTQIYGWLFFAAACVVTPRSWQDGALRWRWNSWSGPSRNDAKNRAALLEKNPFTWRVLRRGPRWVWITLILVAVLWLWLDRLAGVEIFDSGKDIFILALAGLILKANLAISAGRIMSEDRRSGGLELVLTTSLGAKGVLEGQLKALWRLFAWPIIATLLANFTMWVLELPSISMDDRPYIASMHVALAVFLVADALALSQTAMWRGLVARKPGRAGLVALAQIIGLPAVLFVVGISIFALLKSNSGPEPGPMLAFWCLLGGGVDLFFGLRAMANLMENFQLIVSEGWAPAARAA